ncbi:hypothetical protein B0H16DRAFT_1335203 [Mycena metata]|uniref:Uncharacterized protein n=1 Tax=Mycena metata TaxID=1033252 RepID=A0AAD7H6Y7_9AGAR|nr:hypothetical protein B0H16DRAFT_1341341 [Mycena metata]KAJ7721592.1 hypothetical protein B0H16DRAFT_1335203 [Mycena metata]
MSQSSEASEQLPPDLQKQIVISAYVFAGSTAVFVWDILNNLRSEYSLFSRHRLNVATVGYFASRIASFVYSAVNTIFRRPAYPLQDCAVANAAFSAFFPIGVAGTASLFFFRVRAIFDGELLPSIIFGCLWLAVLASSITTTAAGGAIGVGNPTVCVIASRHFSSAFFGLSGIAITVHDTIVFLAISYRLITNFEAEQQTPGEQVKVLFSGAHLPAFPRSLFIDGQMYYMITVVANIVATVMTFVPVSPVYHGFLVIPNVTITSIMACRVYRNTKLGVAHSRADLTLPTLNSVAASGNTVPLSGVQFSGQHTGMQIIFDRT